MKKGFISMIMVAVALVGGVIAFGILDAITADTQTPSSVLLEAHTVASAPTTFTVSNYPIISVSNITNTAHNVSLPTTNYTVSTVDGKITVSGYLFTQGSCCQVSYVYDDGTYLSGGLSRTIVAYIVPIGLLGLLGLAILFRE